MKFSTKPEVLLYNVLQHFDNFLFFSKARNLSIVREPKHEEVV